jgi:hypothetical protein
VATVPITSRTLQLEQQVRDDLAGVTDTQVRDLVAAWATAWDEVAPDLTSTLVEMLISGDRITRAQILRSERLRRALAVIRDNLTELARQSGVRITGDLAQVIEAAGGAQASVIDSQLPPNAPQVVQLDAWSRVDERQIAAIVKRSTEQITALHKPLSASAYDAVRRELIRGVAAGSNPRQTARRIVARTEGAFNGGLQRALVIARTETLDAHRAAAQLGQVPHADVLAGWVWTAQLGPRTCPACFSMHGTEHRLTEPGPLGHQQCRCSRVPKTKSWADLGITGVDEPPSLLPDAATVFSRLSQAEQEAVLGVAGRAAWARGEWPMSAWAEKRSTDGWRDAYYSARPPKPSRGRRAA